MMFHFMWFPLHRKLDKIASIVHYCIEHNYIVFWLVLLLWILSIVWFQVSICKFFYHANTLPLPLPPIRMSRPSAKSNGAKTSSKYYCVSTDCAWISLIVNFLASPPTLPSLFSSPCSSQNIINSELYPAPVRLIPRPSPPPIFDYLYYGKTYCKRSKTGGGERG